MFRKFRESPYFKSAVTILISGGLLILFSSWLNNHQISIGFEAVNQTLAPVYIGVIFAFILCPVYNRCVRWLYEKMVGFAQKKGIPIGSAPAYETEGSLKLDAQGRRRLLTAAKAAASVICVLLVLGLVGMLIYFVLPQFIQSVIVLGNTMPQRLASFSKWLSEHFSKFPQLAKWVNNAANATTKDVLKWARENILQGDAVNIANTISSGVVVAVKYVANAVVGLMIMVYLLNYKDNLFAMTRKIIAATCGQKRRDNLYEFADIVNETFIGFIVGRIIDSFIIGVLTFAVLTLFRIPFALMISVIVGVTNVIPFFGPFIGAIPSTMLLLLEDPKAALVFVVIILVIQQLDGNVIGPKIVGNALGISSFWVLIAVLVGGGLFGFKGMVFGVPVFAVIYRYVNKLITRSLVHKNKPTSTADYFDLKPYGIDDEDEVSIEARKKKHSRPLLKLGYHNKQDEKRSVSDASGKEKDKTGADTKND